MSPKIADAAPRFTSVRTARSIAASVRRRNRRTSVYRMPLKSRDAR